MLEYEIKARYQEKINSITEDLNQLRNKYDPLRVDYEILLNLPTEIIDAFSPAERDIHGTNLLNYSHELSDFNQLIATKENERNYYQKIMNYINEQT
jgi:hypothetical protein